MHVATQANLHPAPVIHRVRVLAAVAVCLLVFDSSARAADDGPSLVILPKAMVLSGREARHALLVERTGAGLILGQVTDDVELSTSDENVVVIEDGFAVPVGNGSAVVTARAQGKSATAEITVVGMDEPFEWSFRNHVQSVLSKAGCSSGACHGALAGKNGFKLSLRGYDPAGDYYTITRQMRSRRIVPSDPGRSLLLTKPSGAVPHKGGLRFRVDSLEYRVLADWIAAGASAPAEDDARLSRLEILPENTVVAPGAKQQLVVRAHFTDGRVEDVTHWAKYTSTNETVANVDDNGLVNVMGYGEGAVTAWYLSQVVVATVSAPQAVDIEMRVFAAAPRRNFIDELVLEKLESLNIPPSPRSSDEEFVRRVYLDTIGVLPTAEEVLAFLADGSADKRDRLIDELLARPEYVDYWAFKWSDLLLVNGQRLQFGKAAATMTSAMWSYYTWIRNHVEANTPWDVMVRELVTARGNTLENGGANFFVLHQDPIMQAETTTVAFLGTSINCARCHNHPLEKWTNDQYFAMANLFARVRVKNDVKSGGFVVYSAADGDLIQPLRGKPQPPTPLDGQAIALDSPEDRRIHLADWLTSPTNPYFARAISNRVWANFMGVGLVEMVDDLRTSNPASNEALLSALADDLISQGFDLKELMRTIMRSEAYQRTSVALAENAADTRFYSRYYTKRLMAEVLLDAMSSVTQSPTRFAGYPVGWRALQLPDAKAKSYFLSTFGSADREATCSCERTADPTMVQVLHISNGDTLNGKLQAGNNRIDQALKAGKSDGEIIDELYLNSLSRHPSAAERSQLLAAIAEAGADPTADRRTLIEDLYWGILSTREFLFNH